MLEYYRLSLLRPIPTGAIWEDIYFEKEGNKFKIITHTPQTNPPLNSKLEKISEEDLKKELSELDIDCRH